MQMEENLALEGVQEDEMDLDAALDGVLDGISEEAATEPNEAILKDVPEPALEAGIEPKPEENELEAVTPEGAQTAPQHWPKQFREQFESASPKVQEAWQQHFKDTMASVSRATESAKTATDFVDRFQSVIPDHVRTHLEASGMDEIGGVEQLIKYYDFADQDPAQYIQWFASEKGLDLSQFSGGNDGQQAGENPQFQQLNQNYQSLSGQVQSLVQSQAQKEHSQSTGAIETFKSAVDEQGNPKHPFFADVEATMSRLIQTDPSIQSISDRSEKLNKAYDMAVYMQPETRAKAIEMQTAQTQAAAQAKSDAERARRASSVDSSPTPGRGAKAVTNLDDVVSQSIEAAISG